jgi:hypothetical protein
VKKPPLLAVFLWVFLFLLVYLSHMSIRLGDSKEKKTTSNLIQALLLKIYVSLVIAFDLLSYFSIMENKLSLKGAGL